MSAKRARQRSPSPPSKAVKIFGVLALVISIVLFAFSLLVVFPAPTYNLWKLRVLVTELGHFVAPLCLLTAFVWRRSTLSRVASLFAVLAAGLLFLPMLGAVRTLRSLPSPRPSVMRFVFSLYAGGETPVTPRRFSLRARDGSTLHYSFYPDEGHTLARVHMPPLVVMIHGGSWQGGEVDQLAPLSYHLTRRGYAVAAITYRFAPHDTFPAQVDDITDEIAELQRRAPELGFDGSHIVVMGRSAGGQLALLYAYTTSEPAIRGAISFYGPADLRWGYDHPSQPRVHDSRRFLRDYLGGTPLEHPSRYEMASPITYAATSAKPTLLVHGESDDLVSIMQTRRLAAALLEAHRPATVIELPWATHGCDYIVRGPCYKISALAVEKFLSEVMPP